MKALQRSVGQAYRNMSIKSKLILFTLLVMSLGITITFSALYYVYSIYDQQIYEKSSEVLNLSSSGIEAELKKIQRLSYVILSDSEIQSTLIAIREGKPEYENYQNRNALKNKLVRFIGSENYVLSLHLIDSLNNESFVEGYSVTIPDDKKNAIREEALQANGEIRFFYPDESDSALIMAREIRSYEGLSLTPIGTLIIRVDMKKLVGDFAAGSPMKKGELLMMSENNNIIFTNKQLSGRLPATFSPGEQTGYEIAEMNGETLFVSHIHSDYTGWTYYNLIPFNQIFKNIVFMKNMLIAGFVATFLTVMIIGLSFARSITKPIERLTGQMKELQKGGLESMELSELAPVSVNMDEVGLMHRTFRMMIMRVNELIKENYAKQLVIKATEFKALQAQINPHFLYNTLESINWLAKMNGQKQISRMVESLGFLLRSSISLDKSTITVGEELEIVRHYVVIQKYRFDERLDFHMEVPEEFHSASIPKLTLQPIMENAIQYALEPKVDPCTIRLSASMEENVLTLTVEDNGIGMQPEFLDRMLQGQVRTRDKGIGLKNIEERIKLAYGDAYGIKVDSSYGQGTKVSVILPLGTEGGWE